MIFGDQAFIITHVATASDVLASSIAFADVVDASISLPTEIQVGGQLRALKVSPIFTFFGCVFVFVVVFLPFGYLREIILLFA